MTSYDPIIYFFIRRFLDVLTATDPFVGWIIFLHQSSYQCLQILQVGG